MSGKHTFSYLGTLAGLVALLALVLSPPVAAEAPAEEPGEIVEAPEADAFPVEWPFTEGAPGGGRHSTLTDIHPGNVEQLQVAWTYRHGDVWEGQFPVKIRRGSTSESTPIVVDGRLFFTTPRNRVIALDPETGEELWTFDPVLEPGRFFYMWINRGVAYWRSQEEEGKCAARVFLATLDARLFALDAATGEPCGDFGTEGVVNLLEGLVPLYDSWEYGVTSPGTVIGDVIVVGSSIADQIRPDAPPGDVRAFDVRTGEVRWTFHTIPHAGEFGAETWETGRRLAGAANVWSTITADLERGLVFLPVSSPSPDFYGGERLGSNLFSDSVVALDGATGERVWHYQTVHHDLWDYDLASPPVLVTVEREDGPVDAVAQATKHGFVFVLHRETGEPLFPVEERPVPKSDLPGERAALTQPFPTAPPPLVPQRLDEDDLYAPTKEHLEACRARLTGVRNEGLFTPPSLQGSVIYPFTFGGASWAGATWDPARQRLFVPVQNKVHIVQLQEVAERAGEIDPNVRPLRGLPFQNLFWWFTGRGTGERYWLHPVTGRTVFQHEGVLCNKPPWGRLVAVDLAQGTIAWSASSSIGPDDPGLGGLAPALSTASGLVFHGGTKDPVMRVHDAETGELVTTFDLPAGLHAGPISYKLQPDGKQFLVVAPGGHIGVGSPAGDYVIAYTLP
ncbi:MAG: pyrroloquinoline quinone-dependent dehydrogenase [Acidobacteriota bacterium]|nr:pyrroloquinoline quinone-dependent dehydrogenase [Acidobacteriota bacterium]